MMGKKKQVVKRKGGGPMKKQVVKKRGGGMMAKMSKGGITAKRKAQKSSPALDAQNAKMTQKGSKKFNMGGKVTADSVGRALKSNYGSALQADARGRAMNKGGAVKRNTSRMNRLEELGRVNAEKANTSRGKRNLSAEKRRIIRGLKK
jgi:hypothetical protein|tara:strand:+ start:987 stop:1430 length:444 start_codon:yes stop_codon:yes gene_type:complete